MTRVARWKRWQRVPKDAFQLRDALRENGFRVTKETYDERHFGNVLMEFHRGACHVQVVRDRSQWFTRIEVDGEWFDAEAWYGLIFGELPDSPRLMTLSEQRDFVLHHLDKIESRCGDRDAKAELSTWLGKWNDRRLGNTSDERP